jgi:hypothetical protein
MAKIIDLRGSGGQLVLLGNAFGLPTSNATSFTANTPIVAGSLRYNPDANRVEYLGRFSEQWLNVASGQVTFLDLIDTPGSFVGRSNHALKVNDAATQIEFVAAGQVDITVEANNTRTVSIVDAGKHIRCTSPAPVTITVPNNSAVAFPIGTTIHFAQAGTGPVSVVGAGGVTIDRLSTHTNATAGQHAVVQIVKHSTNGWTLFGGLAAA